VPGEAHPPLITIAAEHGAGGDLVAPRVADTLGIPFLDRALPAQLAAASAESAQQNALVGRLARASSMLAGEPVERIDHDEARVRTELSEFLASAESVGGVILGRGGAVALADAPAVLHVLLTGELAGRVARIAKREGLPREDAERRVREYDRARREYSRRVFGVDSNDRTLYHLIIDTVSLGIDAAVELVLLATRARSAQPDTSGAHHA
jgi:cytidylate kinase